jgi:hypothetical protein
MSNRSSSAQTATSTCDIGPERLLGPDPLGQRLGLGADIRVETLREPLERLDLATLDLMAVNLLV